MADTSDIEAMNLADVKAEHARLTDAYERCKPADPTILVEALEGYNERLEAVLRRARLLGARSLS